MDKKNNLLNNSNPTWLNDNVQFTRLLSEIYRLGINEHQYVDLSERMNLSKSKINEIFERAEVRWNEHKLQNMLG